MEHTKKHGIQVVAARSLENSSSKQKWSITECSLVLRGRDPPSITEQAKIIEYFGRNGANPPAVTRMLFARVPFPLARLPWLALKRSPRAIIIHYISSWLFCLIDVVLVGIQSTIMCTSQGESELFEVPRCRGGLHVTKFQITSGPYIIQEYQAMRYVHMGNWVVFYL